MEGEGPLLKDGSLSLQTSLFLRELPPSAPARAERSIVSLCLRRVRLGEVFGLDREVRIYCRLRLSHGFGWRLAFGFGASHPFGGWKPFWMLIVM